MSWENVLKREVPTKASVLERLNSNKELFSTEVMKRWSEGTTTVLFADILTIVSLLVNGEINTEVSDKELALTIQEELDDKPQHITWGMLGEEPDDFFETDDREWDSAEPEWDEDERNRTN